LKKKYLNENLIQTSKQNEESSQSQNIYSDGDDDFVGNRTSMIVDDDSNNQVTFF